MLVQPAPGGEASPEFRVEKQGKTTKVTLAAGDVAVFDNTRILHARTPFDTAEPRHLQGCYIDLDAVRSAARLASV